MMQEQEDEDEEKRAGDNPMIQKNERNGTMNPVHSPPSPPPSSSPPLINDDKSRPISTPLGDTSRRSVKLTRIDGHTAGATTIIAADTTTTTTPVTTTTNPLCYEEDDDYDIIEGRGLMRWSVGKSTDVRLSEVSCGGEGNLESGDHTSRLANKLSSYPNVDL
jgi:hypothetical protein